MKYTIVDGHIDLAFAFMMRELSPLDTLHKIRQEDALASVALPEMHRAGVKLIFGTLFVSPDAEDGPKVAYSNREEATKRGQEQIGFYNALTLRAKKEEHGFTVGLVNDNASLDACLGNDDQIGIVVLMEGAEMIQSPGDVQKWYDDGVRIIGPAWNTTAYAGGAFEPDKGFTDMGFELLAEMEKVGMILDLSHLSQKAVEEALARFNGPVIATHANSRAICDTPRNLTDDTLKEIARRKGMVGIVLYDGFIRRPLRGRVHLPELMPHIEHMAKVMGGTQFIGIGSDMDGGFGKTRLPFEVENHLDFNAIADALAEIGLADSAVAGIMGNNWLDFLKRTWA